MMEVTPFVADFFMIMWGTLSIISTAFLVAGIDEVLGYTAFGGSGMGVAYAVGGFLQEPSGTNAQEEPLFWHTLTAFLSAAMGIAVWFVATGFVLVTVFTAAVFDIPLEYEPLLYIASGLAVVTTAAVCHNGIPDGVKDDIRAFAADERTRF